MQERPSAGVSVDICLFFFQHFHTVAAYLDCPLLSILISVYSPVWQRQKHSHTPVYGPLDPA